MRKSNAWWLGLLMPCLGMTLLARPGFSESGGQPASKETIAALFHDWNKALQSGKAEEVLKLYAPDAILLPTVSNKVRHNHEEIKDYFLTLLASKPSVKMDEQNIRIFGPMAINSGVYTIKLTRDGKPAEIPARFTFVYQRQGDRWVIVEHHSSAMPEGKR
jgi:uncharacterized protein (TIGR02246 family)